LNFKNLILPKNLFLNVSDNVIDVFKVAADQFCEFHINKQRRLYIMPGGNTPIPFFKNIAMNQLDWINTSILLSDERMVPRLDKNSNYKTIKTHLIDNISNSSSPFICDYNDQLGKLDSYLSEIESPDLSILGFGKDGHTASIFPNKVELLHSNKNIIKVNNSWEPFNRVSLTLKYILKSKIIMFILKGREKASSLNECLTGDYNPVKFPVQYLLKNFKRKIYIYCDKAAASALKY
jgi:6-phosphogluconolactonase